jgi:hypothetical protein
MHQFLAGSTGKLGVRLSAKPGGLEDLAVNLPSGKRLEYRLLTLPVYLAKLVPELEGL